MERGEFEQGPIEARPSVVYKRKGSKGLLVSTILFALIAVALGVCLAITLVQKDNDKTSNSAKSDKEAIVDSKDGSDTDSEKKILAIVTEAAEAFRTATAGDYGHYEAIKVYDTDFAFPIGNGIAAPSNHSYGLISGGEGLEGVQKNILSARTKILTGISNVLSKYGIKKIEEPAGLMNWGNEPDSYAWYKGGNIYCHASTYYGFDFACADEGWISAENKELILKLAEAYKKKENRDVGYLGVDAKDVTVSSNGKYERVEAEEEDAVASFYRKKGDENWTYFTSRQAGPYCQEFNTAELKEAYAGEKCYDSKGNESVVK